MASLISYKWAPWRFALHDSKGDYTHGPRNSSTLKRLVKECDDFNNLASITIFSVALQDKLLSFICSPNPEEDILWDYRGTLLSKNDVQLTLVEYSFTYLQIYNPTDVCLCALCMVIANQILTENSVPVNNWIGKLLSLEPQKSLRNTTFLRRICSVSESSKGRLEWTSITM